MPDVATPGVVTSVEIDSCYGMSDEILVATGKQVYPGAFVASDASGNMVAASDATAVLSLGVACQGVLGDGTLTCRYDQGIHRAVAGTNPPLAGDKGKLCYFQDDQTLTMTPGTLVAGTVYKVDSLGPQVLIGAGLKGSSGGRTYLTLLLADLVSADASVYHIASPVAGKITGLRTSLQAHALAGGNATVTGKIGSTAITGGVVTMLNAGSAIGDTATATPTAANAVVAGSDINFTIGGTQTNTAAQGVLIIEISTSA